MENLKVHNLTDFRSPVALQAGPPEPTGSPASGPAKPKLLDQVRLAIRTRHYSYMTEKAYVAWIKRFIFFHDESESVSGFGCLILSECGAKGTAWLAALASIFPELFTTSSAGAIKGRRFSETPMTTVALGDCLKMFKGAIPSPCTPMF